MEMGPGLDHHGPPLLHSQRFHHFGPLPRKMLSEATQTTILHMLEEVRSLLCPSPSDGLLDLHEGHP